VSLLRLLRIKLRLRRLQRAYYNARQPNDPVVVDYLRELAAARALLLGGTPRKRALHAGSGAHYVAGWINADRELQVPLDLVADFGRGIPLRDGSLQYIHSEDFLEHLDAAEGRRFLGECHRVLRPGGVMRLLTPDLDAIVRRVYLDREARHLQWCGVYLGAPTACEALNMHLRMSGDHRFVYDEEHLAAILRGIGFEVRRARYNASPDPFLRFLDLRDFGLNLFLECRRP